MLLVLAAGVSAGATDDLSLPGSESQQAVDLFQAHSPAFGGADSTLVFTVGETVVTLLGDHAWWLPAWLDRVLPNISLEGSRNTTEIEAEGEQLPERETVPV